MHFFYPHTMSCTMHYALCTSTTSTILTPWMCYYTYLLWPHMKCSCSMCYFALLFLLTEWQLTFHHPLHPTHSIHLHRKAINGESASNIQNIWKQSTDKNGARVKNLPPNWNIFHHSPQNLNLDQEGFSCLGRFGKPEKFTISPQQKIHPPSKSCFTQKMSRLFLVTIIFMSQFCILIIYDCLFFQDVSDLWDWR